MSNTKKPLTVSPDDQDAILQVAEVMAKISSRLAKFNRIMQERDMPIPFDTDIVALEASVVLLLTIMSSPCDCEKCKQSRAHPAPASHN